MANSKVAQTWEVLRKAFDGPSSTLGSVTAWTVGLNSKPHSIQYINVLFLLYCAGQRARARGSFIYRLTPVSALYHKHVFHF